MCAVMLSVAAFAQKGEQAVGINLNVSPCLESGASLTNFGLSAKYQYGITDAIRVEGVLGYDFKSKGVGFFEVGANAHYLFNVANKIKVYPLIGLGYANVSGSGGGTYTATGGNPITGEIVWEQTEKGGSSSLNKVYFNVGAGAEYALTDRFGINFELKYQYIKDFSRLPISLGVTYKF